MAISFSFSRFLVLVVLLLAYSPDCIADKVDDICARTINPSFCQQFYRSDPRSSGSDYRSLAFLALALTEAPMGQLKDLLLALGAKASDEELRKRFKLCSGDTRFAIDEIILTRQFLTSKDYFNMVNHASRICFNVALCDRQFAKPPPNEPAELIQATGKVRYAASVISAAANILLGRDPS